MFIRITQGAPQYVLPRIREDGSIRIGVTVDTPPLGNLDGDTIVGLEADLARLLGAKFVPEQAVVLVPVTNRTRAAKLDNGDVDFLVSMVANVSANQDRYSLTGAYFEDPITFRTNFTLTQVGGLSQKHIGVFQGSLAKTMLQNAIGKMDEENKPILVDYTSFPELSADLQSGALDGACGEATILNLLDAPNMQLQSYQVGTLRYAVASRDREVDLAKALKNHIASFWEDGTFTQLYQKYGIE
ncbi:transporter substrate-binding domain-containing protein [Eubacteriales bacterium OttesenSCG-928-M02]|nr:transporter substrate-binding domain-containing protein [Eubacteriales bacterium OttesenSCG-928-M02]